MLRIDEAWLNLIWPLSIFANGTGRCFGLMLAILGAAMIAWGRSSLLSGGTNVDPTLPTACIRYVRWCWGCSEEAPKKPSNCTKTVNRLRKMGGA
jgi:hypothetical protein